MSGFVKSSSGRNFFDDERKESLFDALDGKVKW